MRPPLQVRDTILYVEQHSVDPVSQMALPDGTYENVTLLWKGYEPSSYPHPLPDGVTEMNLLTHTEAEIEDFWQAAVSRWKERHGFVDFDDFDPEQMIAPAPF